MIAAATATARSRARSSGRSSEHSFANLRTDEEVPSSSRVSTPTPCRSAHAGGGTIDATRCRRWSRVRWPWSYVSDSSMPRPCWAMRHAIVPFYGRGMNCAFEGCAGAGGTARAGPGDIRGVLERVRTVAKPDAEAIADMAIRNFRRCATRRRGRTSCTKKRVEQTVHGCSPTAPRRSTTW